MRQIAETFALAAIVAYTASGTTGGRTSRERSNRSIIALPFIVKIVERAKLIVERFEYLPNFFTARDIYRWCWRTLKDKEAVTQALELLCRSNYIREFPIEGNELGRRPDRDG